MVRAGVAVPGLVLGLVLGLLGASSCSLLLDFGGPAGIDAPYTEAECAYGEPNDTPALATPLTPADLGPAAICAGEPADRDFYRFTVPAGTASVSVRVSFTNRPNGDLDLRLTDATGATTFGQSRGFDDVEEIVCPGTSPPCQALPEGEYAFEVFPALPGAVNRYDLSLSITPM